MSKLLAGIGAVGALMLATMSSSSAVAAPAPADARAASQPAPVKRDDVPAPPMSLLFGIGAVGLIWGRRLAAKKNREEAKPD